MDDLTDREDKMSETWMTKWGPRRVRQDPPTLEEAFVAAGSMTDDFAQKIEIAASLMGLPVDEVRGQAAKAAAAAARPSIVSGRGRSVVVQYTRPRAMRTPASRSAGGAGK
jgi:hypothetical protein